MESDDSAKPQLAVGGRFRGYDVLKVLGRGGMGEVYLLRSPKDGEFFAAKIIFPPPEGDERKAREWRKRFSNEAKFAKDVHHPNLIRVYDVGEDDSTGLCYIIMDFIEGGSLADKIRAKGRLPIDMAITIAVKVAMALEVAHEAGIVHRDIKPDNILLDDEGEPHIADLGIAKFTGPGHTTTVTRTDMIVGTPSYMAPEQMMDSHEVDCRADIYSLGVVLYEMLTGSRPNADSTVMELLAKAIKGEELPDVSVLRPEVSVAVSYVLSRLVSPKPGDRPGSAAEAARLLNDASTGKFKVPKAYVRCRRIARGAVRARNIIALAMIAILATAVVVLAVMARRAPGGGDSAATSGITDASVRTAKIGDFTWSYRLLNGEAVLENPATSDQGEPCCCVEPKPTAKLSIPSEIDGYKVGAIGSHAFYKCALMTDVEIPEGVREIGDEAFAFCVHLTELRLPRSVVATGRDAFMGCISLGRIDLARCSDFQDFFFTTHVMLEEITVAEDNPSFLSSDGALYTKDGKKLIKYPPHKKELKLRDGVEEIDRLAFDASQIKSIKLPEGIKAVDFSGITSLKYVKEIEFPESLERLSIIKPADEGKVLRYVFNGDAPKGAANNALPSVVAEGKRGYTYIEVRRGTKGWDGNPDSTGLPDAFPPNTSPEDTVPISYKGEAQPPRDVVDAQVFDAVVDGYCWTYRLADDFAVLVKCERCAAGEISQVPAFLDGHKVVAIADYALARNSDIVSLKLPDGIVALGDCVFAGSGRLKRVELPSSLMEIGPRSFENCPALEEIVVAPDNPKYESIGGALRQK